MPCYAILGGPQTTLSFGDLLVDSITVKGDKAKSKGKGTWDQVRAKSLLPVEPRTTDTLSPPSHDLW